MFVRHTLGLLTMAALLAVAPAALAKDLNGSNFGAAEFSGKYTLSDGGYVVFSVDDRGRAEGFYEHEGQFGELYGEIVDGALVGTWIEPGDKAACAEPRRGVKNWSNVELRFNSLGSFAGTLTSCDGSEETLIWGRRR